MSLPCVPHPVIVDHTDVDLDLLSALKGLEGLPLAVGGAVNVSVVGAALQVEIKRTTICS